MTVFSGLDLPHPCTPYQKLIINVAISGIVPTRKNTPYLPVTTDDMIKNAVACFNAGASIVHIHPRDKHGKPTHRKDVCADIIRGIRENCPALIICVSTSGRLENVFEKRSEVLELEEDLKPDMASLTLGSLNFINQVSVNTPEMIEKLALKMRANNIMPELEIFDTGMINTAKVLIKKGILKEPFYCNLLLGSIYSVPATLFDLTHLVKSLPSRFHWGVAGIGRFQLNMNLASVLMGGNVRVGLEDNIYYDPARKKLADNETFVKRIVDFAGEIGREISTPQETRARLGL